MTPRILVSMLGSAAFALLLPAAATAQTGWSISVGNAYDYGSGYNDDDRYGRYSRHDRLHDRLDDRHDDVHDALDEEHDEAHAQGLNRWEHAQLHRDLRYQHERADYQIARQHQREHRRDRWQRRYYGYNYGGYGY